MKKAAPQNLEGRVMARLFARDLREIISASEDTQNLGTTPSTADTTASEAATSERAFES